MSDAPETGHRAAGRSRTRTPRGLPTSTTTTSASPAAARPPRAVLRRLRRRPGRAGRALARDADPGHRLDADADRGLAVPGGRPRPCGPLLRAPRACGGRTPSSPSSWPCSRRWRSSWSRSCPVIADQVRSLTDNVPAVARPAAAQPSGPAARRRVRHHRQDPELRHQRRLRRRHLRRRAGRRAGRARRAVQRLHRHRADALLPRLAARPRTPPSTGWLRPRGATGSRGSATGWCAASAATSPAPSSSRCAPASPR